MNEYYSGADQSVVAASDGGFIAQLPSIIWQRRWFLIIPLIVAAIAAVVAVFLLPRQYESSATLLVQAPSLPTDVIGSGRDSDLIDRRIESLRQQIITRPKLLSLIEANELYPSERARKPLSAIIETMREHIALTSIDAELNAKPEDKTIAFKLAYRYSDPRKAQAIVQSLMEQIVELNSTVDVADANQAVQFLTEQSNNVKRDIGALEQQISRLNVQYGGILSRSASPAMGGNSASYDFQIAELLRANQTLALQRENVGTQDQRDPIVAGAEAALAGARAQYSEDHPDVRLARLRLEEAKKLAAQNVKKVPVDNLDQQITFNNQQIATLRAAKARDQGQASAAVSSQSRAPAVQQETLQLQQKLDGLYKQSDAISQRLMTAQAGARAANEQLGERLVVVDPPVIADKPVSPNRLMILGGGLGAGLGAGMVMALLIEMFLRPIRTPGRVAQITGSPTLALIPMIESSADTRPSLWRRITGNVWRNPFRRRPKEEVE